ncbi:MAG: hypothetical protein IJX28_01380 [Clostridia bacterium]|nr:hypothetical protein [Clostridia bacterium]
MIHTLTLTPPPPHRDTVLRYAGISPAAAYGDPSLPSLLEDCLSLAAEPSAFSVCYGVFPLRISGEDLDLGFATLSSADLLALWKDCRHVLAFAATVGLSFDRAVARAEAHSPTRALLLDALGSERVEALCDTFCQRMATQYASEGALLTPRFSPGYGDLPLSFQIPLFQALDCSRRIGLTLNQSLSMSPSKSVTAMVGIRYQSQ